MPSAQRSPIGVIVLVAILVLSGCVGFTNPGSQGETSRNDSVDGLVIENYDENESYRIDVVVLDGEEVLFWKSVRLEALERNETENEVRDGVHLTPSGLENASDDLLIVARINDQTDGESVRTSELDLGSCHTALIEVHPDGHIVFGKSCLERSET